MELLVAATFCCLGLFTILVFGLVFLVILRKSRPYSAQEMDQVESRASGFASQAAAGLLPWTSLDDLSCQWHGTVSGLIIGEYRGIIKSLSNPNAPGLLACYLSLKGRQGVLHLRTSAHEARLDIKADVAQVAVGGRFLGSIRLDEGTIFDSGGQPIGRYHHHRGLRWQIGSTPLSSRYGPVELYGRTVAEVNDGLARSGPWSGDAARRPLVRNLAPNLTPDEESWLLAIAGLESYRWANRHRNRPRSNL